MLPMARNFYRPSSAVRDTVEVILADIEGHGDDAVRQLSIKFDKWDRESYRLLWRWQL